MLLKRLLCFGLLCGVLGLLAGCEHFEKRKSSVFLDKKYELHVGSYQTRYIFHRDSVDIYRKLNDYEWAVYKGGRKTLYTNYEKNAPAEVIAARPNEWVCYLEKAPVHFEEHSLRIDWSACKPETLCTEFGANTDSEILNVESDGMLLRSARTTEYALNLEE
jgi:hypothetical protein